MNTGKMSLCEAGRDERWLEAFLVICLAFLGRHHSQTVERMTVRIYQNLGTFICCIILFYRAYRYVNAM